jgi:hypothetical protein
VTTAARAVRAGDDHTGPGSAPRAGEVSDHGALTVHRLDAEATSDRVVALLGERLAAGSEPSDLAVLARVNSALLPVQVALTDARIAHTGPLDASALGRTGIRTALAYLRLGLDLERIRRDDLFDTINRPARKVKSAVQPLLRGGGGRLSMRQLEQVADALDGTHQERFAGYLGDLRHLEQAITDGADTARCLWIVRNRIGLGEAMDALDASRTRPEGSSHGDDLDALEQLAALQPDPAVFRDWLADHLKVPGDRSGVVLSTVHRVKGMEWDHVVVFAANQGLFPHRLADDVEEERRVFHVAVTRCRHQVDVVADRERVSPFVDELTRAAEPRPAPRDAATQPLPEDVAPTAHPDGGTVAARGLRVELAGGLTGRVVEVERDGVVLRVVPAVGVEDGAGSGAEGGAGGGADGGAEPVTIRSPFGTRARIGGRATTLVAPPVRRPAGGGTLLGGDPGDEVDDALYDALRSWRSQVAATSGVPAYLVFHDRHLQLIAGRKPRTLLQLADCPGVGPTKLERYGDDLLDVIEAHR